MGQVFKWNQIANCPAVSLSYFLLWSRKRTTWLRLFKDDQHRHDKYKEEECRVLYFWNPDDSSIQGMVDLSALSTLHPFADQKKSEKYWEAVAANMCSFCWSVWRLQYQKFQSEISIFETLSRHTHPLKSFIVWQFRSYRRTILSRTILTFQSLH